jgi:hypothetical protein
MKIKIKPGDEFITKSSNNAYGGYVLTVVSIVKNKNKNDDDQINFFTSDMHYSKSGSAKFSTKQRSAKRWWFNDYCQKINRENN